jgi:CHAD domain-containing protein
MLEVFGPDGTEGIISAVRRNERTLARDLPRALEGDVDAVHDARVASRRLREAFPLLARTDCRTTKVRRRLRRITRALGTVRELDVATALLESAAGERSDAETWAGPARQELVRERNEKLAAAVERLQRIDVGRLRRSVSRLFEAREWGSRTASLLASRVVRRGTALRAAVEEAGVLYNPEHLHAVRIAAKKLRYTLELAHAFSAGPLARDAVDRLRSAQRVLGRLHDLELFVVRLRAEDRARSESAVAAARDLEQQVHRLHADYLKRRAGLLQVTLDCRRIAALLAAPSRRVAARVRHSTQDHGRNRQPLRRTARDRSRAR